VRIYPGDGTAVINDREPLRHFGRRELEQAAMRPLEVTGLTDRFRVSVKVVGGGVSGQAGAVAHGLARALCVFDPELRGPLKAAGLMTRDPRMKERKKPGLKRARKAPQYTKR
jgi:small subunit ribosomal protein S9